MNCAPRYLPEAVPVLESILLHPSPPAKQPVGRIENHSPMPPTDFAYDPAAAARMLLKNPGSGWDARQTVQLWALYDVTSARSWVTALPPGPERPHAEVALLE